MSGADIANIVTIIVALFGGGVVGVVIKALIEKRKINAEANNTNIKSLLEIDQRMNERMAKLEERVAHLEQENYKLKSEKLELEKKAHVLEAEVIQLKADKKELIEENDSLKNELEKYRENNEKEVN